MNLSSLLQIDRIRIEGRLRESPLTKEAALSSLSADLASSCAISKQHIYDVLAARERLQSTGIGEGVAIPHGFISDLPSQKAALLVVPGGVDFDSVDHQPATILVAVIGPKETGGEHLRTLARISRVLRDSNLRRALLHAENSSQIYELLVKHDPDG